MCFIAENACTHFNKIFVRFKCILFIWRCTGGQRDLSFRQSGNPSATMHLSNFLRGEGVRVMGFYIRTETEWTASLTGYAIHCYSADVCIRESGQGEGVKTDPLNLFINISRGSDILGKGSRTSRQIQPCKFVIHFIVAVAEENENFLQTVEQRCEFFNGGGQILKTEIGAVISVSLIVKRCRKLWRTAHIAVYIFVSFQRICQSV